MGSKGSQQVQTNQNQTYSPDPNAYGSIWQALQQAQGVAQTPFHTPAAPVAGFSGQQQQAFDITGQTAGYAQPYINQASRDFSPQGTQDFLNPYTANVTANLKDVFGQQQQQTTGQLTQAAGGVGADRIGVGQAELGKQQGLAAGQTYAGLYGNAVNQAQSAGFGQANLGTAGQNAQLQGAQALLGTGGLQQQLSQAQLNSPYQQQLQQIAWPYQNAQFLAGITGALAPGLGGTTQGSGSTTYPGQSWLGSLAGLGMAGAGLAGYGNKQGWFGSGKGGGSPQPSGGEAPAARGGRINPYAAGGATDEGEGFDQLHLAGVDDRPIDGTPSLVPDGKITAIQPHIPQLNLTPPSQQGSGSGGNVLGDVAKIATMFAARGGTVDGPDRHGMIRRHWDMLREENDIRSPYAPPIVPGQPVDDPQGMQRDVRRIARGGRAHPFHYAGGGDVLPFAERAAPADEAIKSGVFDPQGANAMTGFEAPPAAAELAGVDDADADTAGDDALPASAETTAGATVANPFADAPAESAKRRDRGFADSPWAALLSAGLGTLAASGQRDARGLPTTPLSAIGQGGLQGLKTLESQRASAQKDDTIEHAAKQLEQQAQFHRDQYEKMTPTQRASAEHAAGQLDYLRKKPVPGGQRIDPLTGLPLTTYVVPGPNGDFVPVHEPAPSPQSALPANATPTQGIVPGKDVPRDVDMTALEGLDQGYINHIRAVDEGRESLSAVPMRQRYAFEQRLHAYDPNFDQTVWGARNQMQSDLSPKGTTGKLILAANQLLPHLNVASEKAVALANTNYPAANTVKNWWLTQTGDPRVKAFNTVREVAALDAARLLRGSGAMAEKDIEQWRSLLADAGSPQQLHENIALLGDDLIGARYSSIEHSYRMLMRKDPPELRSPEAKAALESIKSRRPGAAGGGGGGGGASAPRVPAADRFNQLTGGGMSKPDAYKKLHEEGY